MRVLFPEIKPYASQRLAVDNRHTLHAEECGIPNGLPVLFLHGGPGAGKSQSLNGAPLRRAPGLRISTGR